MKEITPSVNIAAHTDSFSRCVVTPHVLLIYEAIKVGMCVIRKHNIERRKSIDQLVGEVEPLAGSVGFNPCTNFMF